MLRRRVLGRGVLILAIVAFVALAATAALAQSHSATPANGRAGSRSVKATNKQTWNPVKLVVTRGARVTWSNPTYVDHDVVAYGGKWSFNKTIAHGHSVSFVFSNAGSYLFRCTLHSYVSGGVCHGMCGRIVVQK
jgi:plastocyanin